MFGAPQSILNVIEAAELTLDDPEDLISSTSLETACTHIYVRTTEPLVLDRGAKLLLPLPPYRHRRPVETHVGRDLKYDESSPRLACDRYSLTAVPEALTISILPPWPIWIDS